MQTGTSVLRCHSSHPLLFSLLSLVWILSAYVLVTPVRKSYRPKLVILQEPLNESCCEKLTSDSCASETLDKKTYQASHVLPCSSEQEARSDLHEICFDFQISGRFTLQPDKQVDDWHRKPDGSKPEEFICEPFSSGKIQ